MNDAELYHTNNTLQKRDAVECLEEYAKRISWKNYGYTVIDIGSGDGSVTTSILTKFLPSNCKRILGCDISNKMVEFANEHHASDHTSFTALDIEGELPDELRGYFDHAFSFYTFHWIRHQETAFTNIYNLLARGGDCLLIFVASHPVYDAYRVLARQPKYSYWLREVERSMPPQHDCQDPEDEIKRMMTYIGFKSVDVKCTEKSYTYASLEATRYAVAAINPFKLPEEMVEHFYEDLMNVMSGLHNVHCTEDDPVRMRFTYRLITVYGKK